MVVRKLVRSKPDVDLIPSPRKNRRHTAVDIFLKDCRYSEDMEGAVVEEHAMTTTLPTESGRTANDLGGDYTAPILPPMLHRTTDFLAQPPTGGILS
jgi:hypothetical protein